MTPLYVLISLHRGYGLGDAVQMSAVLRHIAKYRPHWIVDYQADEGKHQVGRGIVANTFAYGNPYPKHWDVTRSYLVDAYYDTEVQIVLYDTWQARIDRPNTHVTLCLERLGIPWDADCGRYQVDVSAEARESASTLLYGWRGVRNSKIKPDIGCPTRNVRYVAVHYEGDSAQDRKNLTHSQVDDVCCIIERLGYVPLILDWRNRSPLPYHRITTPQNWGSDAEMVCSVISQCAAFVGIDSGPAKCASATNVPSLVVWTGHHPAPFHDPAPNTTHLVPPEYNGMEPVCGDRGVITWFESHYNIRHYYGNPINEISTWLEGVLV